MAAVQDMKNLSMSAPKKIGIMDILSSHLQFIKDMFDGDPIFWIQASNTFKNLEADYDHARQRDLCEKGSVALRNQGNVHFKAGRFPEARLLYTQSLAAGVKGPLGALAHSNRSAALFHMRLYKDCIKDIDNALVLGYPNEALEYTLHLRKAMCLQFLKKDHTEALQDALKAIEEHSKGDLEELKAKVLAKMKSPEPVFNMDLPKPNIKWTLPELSYGPSAEVPSFSSAVSIKYSKDLGRHLVANRPINTGDVLIVEECKVAAIEESVHWEFCSFCFKPCMSLIPCKLCALMYCSVTCRESDWTLSHKHSCFFTKNLYSKSYDTVLDLSKTQIPAIDRGSLSSGTITIMQRLVHSIGIDRIRRAAKNNEPMQSWSANDPRTKGFRDGKFSSSDLEAWISLEDHFDKLDAKEKTSSAAQAMIQAAIYNVPCNEMQRVAAIILKLMLVIRFNRRFIYAFKASYERLGLPRILIGEVLYLSSSLINHACDASMYHISYGSHIVFRARRPINKGEQLTDCYVVSAANALHTERQTMCMKLHKFQCKCEACVDAWPLMQMMPTLSELKNKAVDVMQAAEFQGARFNEQTVTKFVYFCQFNIAADKEMLPKMVALLREFYEKGKNVDQWYYQMQECVKNHYRTHGNCFFFKNAKEIIEGKNTFDANEAIELVPERLKNCIERTGPFGLPAYI